VVIYPALLLAGYFVWLALVYVMQDRMLFPGHYSMRRPGATIVPAGLGRVWLTLGHGSLV